MTNVLPIYIVCLLWLPVFSEHAYIPFQYSDEINSFLRQDARVQVNLIDQNDHRPDFFGLDENGRYPAAVSEEEDPTQELVHAGTVFAIDADGEYPYNNVSGKYSLYLMKLHYDNFLHVICMLLLLYFLKLEIIQVSTEPMWEMAG